MRGVLRILSFTALCTLAGVAAASAQVSDRMDFTTKFRFVVGRTTLPAGHYSIERLTTDGSVMAVTGRNRTVMVPMMRMSAAPNQTVRDRLVFVHRGNRYVLSQVWSESSRAGVQVIGVTMPASHTAATKAARPSAATRRPAPKTVRRG